MISIQEKVDCCGCTACFAVCPVSCISMETDHEGFDYPAVDQEKCIHCGKCLKVCPVPNQVKNPEEPEVYACYNKDEETRLKSSSGGIFSLLAENILNQQGVVFGAKFNENFDVVHDYTETIEGLVSFRGSKYVQSRMGDCYQQAKRFLESGRYVLFSGTPCQIAGLKKFLTKDYSNLLAVDLICHGVPSPMVFQIYKEGLEKQYQSTINSFSFRNKEHGWEKFYNVVVVGTHCDSSPFHQNIYMKGFLCDLYLRPSCHKCAAKNFQSGSDITLADYWGVTKVHPTFDDDRGISAVIINSTLGSAIFDVIKSDLMVLKSQLSHIIKYNSPLIQSVEAHPKRCYFFENFEKIPFQELTDICIKSQQTFWKVFKRKIRRIFINRITRRFCSFNK